jgi:8-oxo-dGTP pyrophosphatase MutT (NUDIX family)
MFLLLSALKLNIVMSTIPERKVRAAGVLPYAIVRKSIVLLLGQEKYDPKWRDSDCWSDFGGRVEKDKDKSILETAAREFYEESGGVVMSLCDMKQRLQRNEYALYIDVPQSKNTFYRMYLVQVPYRNYPETFAHTTGLLSYLGVEADVVEKRYLKWYSLANVKDAIMGEWQTNRYSRKPKFLNRFQDAIRKLLDEHKMEELFVRF